MAARCVICDHVVVLTDGLTSCPKCGTRSLPCDPRHDVSIKINWHELRILCMWAESHANTNEGESQPDTSMRQTVYSIVRRIEVQHPNINQPLTLGGEIRQLKQVFPDIETNIPHEEGFDPTTVVEREAGDELD